jgi:regulatory protein
MPYPAEELQDGRRKSYPEGIVWQKICKWCAFQERSQQEVREKLFAYGLDSNTLDNMLVRLIGDGFVNEERFAIAFAGGKFRQLGWGRVRIRYALKSKGVSEACIRTALSKINDEEYLRKLKELIQKRAKQEREKDVRKRNWKLASYAISRGYEPDVVSQGIKELQGL